MLVGDNVVEANVIERGRLEGADGADHTGGLGRGEKTEGDLDEVLEGELVLVLDGAKTGREGLGDLETLGTADGLTLGRRSERSHR